MKHLTKEHRLRIEVLVDEGRKAPYIANYMNISLRTVYYELKRGAYPRLLSTYETVTRYSADIAQNDYDYKATAKGTQLKLGCDYSFVKFCSACILKLGWSPDSIIGFIRKRKLRFKCNVCTKTLYKYINDGLISGVSNDTLLRKPEQKRPYKKVHERVKKPLNTSISERPKEVDDRNTFGHWEMDTVIGKREVGECLLVLTERLTRQELTFKIAGRTQNCVLKVLNKLERSNRNFKKIFKSITIDNGGEFLDQAKIEKSCITKGKRTKAYYCHPFSSWERGSNENANSIIRRYIPKGTPLENYSHAHIKFMQTRINQMPRKILGYSSSKELFNYYISQL